MSFAQTEYLPFLALVVLAWTCVPARARVAAMLLASWVFYLWVRPRDGVWLAASTAIDYCVALRISATEDAALRRRWLRVSLVLNVGLLATFKYSGFLVTNLGRLSGALGGPAFVGEDLALPLGISFYTFQTLSYTLDVYHRRIVATRSPVEYALYVSFFPQLLAGPIERASHLLPQLRALAPLEARNLSLGVRRILWGLGKKWLLADRLLGELWPVFSTPVGRDSVTLVLTAAGMLVVLYLDFSAYTDMARGTARLFGVELVENFKRPFLATSIHDWARRWHVSLVDWMFDYVWMPLAKGRMTHLKAWRANLCIMGLFGLWHGARWTFAVWGLAYGVLISIEHSRRLARGGLGSRGGLSGAGAGAWAGVTARAVVAWALTALLGAQFIVLFFSPDLASAGGYFVSELRGGLPQGGAEWGWCGALGAGLGVLLGVHALGGWVDLEALWGRLPGWVRVGGLGVGGWACWAYRVSEVRGFVYFDF